MSAVETIVISPRVSVEICYDFDPPNPAEFDTLGKITYRNTSRYVLGTEAIDVSRFEEIRDGIASGKLLGVPVYALVHGSATLSTSPFHDPWDSGQSGFVYTTRERGLTECLTEARVLEVLRSEVEEFDTYLQGEVYGYVIRVDDEIKDACWGIYGRQHAKDEGLVYGQAAARHLANLEAKEREESDYWAARDVATV